MFDFIILCIRAIVSSFTEAYKAGKASWKGTSEEKIFGGLALFVGVFMVIGFLVLV